MVSGDEVADPEVGSIEEIVPARAVLTELARGFLLAHESNRERAVRFAEGFLREQTGGGPLERVGPVAQVPHNRLTLARGRRAIEPSGLPPP